MAYSNEANAGFRITGTSGLGTYLGNIRALIEKIIVREELKADANNHPVSRPVDDIDARVTVEFLDNSGGISHTAAAANLTMSYSEGNGGAASVIIGALVAGSIRHNWGRKQGGFGVQQENELQGALTYTPTA
ncbi:MAG TPA: hypothetical protein VEK08_27015 [Planctomycetota bacterium]|nr:hypothetical protein [Planctomycetota bacterium]